MFQRTPDWDAWRVNPYTFAGFRSATGAPGDPVSSTQPICRAWRAERPSVPRKNWPSDHASACIRWACPT